jgi:hypothetical protein
MTVSILFKAKKGYSFIFLRCRLRYRKDEVRFVTSFQSYFTNAIVSVEEDTYAAVYATTPKEKKQLFLF